MKDAIAPIVIIGILFLLGMAIVHSEPVYRDVIITVDEGKAKECTDQGGTYTISPDFGRVKVRCELPERTISY